MSQGVTFGWRETKKDQFEVVVGEFLGAVSREEGSVVWDWSVTVLAGASLPVNRTIQRKTAASQSGAQAAAEDAIGYYLANGF